MMVDLRAIPGAAELYFIRHGESEGNRDGIIQNRNPSRLTDNGRSQAREAGAWFASKTLALILTSPLARASETAHIIAAESGVTAIRTTAERIAELLSRAGKIWSLLALPVGQGQRRLPCVTHSGFLQWNVRPTLGTLRRG